jgi:hypothetical protein
MSTLLISVLGDAGPGSDAGRRLDRYRLPGGERIVETAHLGVELARALGARKLVLLATGTAAFDSLVDLLPPEDREAPIDEEAATLAEPGEPGPAAAGDSALEEDPGDGSGSPKESETQIQEEAADAGSIGVLDAHLAPPATGDAASSLEAAAPATGIEAAPAEASGPGDSAPSGPKAPEVRSEQSPGAAPPELPLRRHEPDPRPLRVRLAAMAEAGRADRAALDALARRLQRSLQLEHVRCLVTSEPSDPRSALAALRTLIETPVAGDQVHVDASFGPRSFPAVALLALHYLREFRPEVEIGSVHLAAPEHRDHLGVAPITTLDGPLEMLGWMGLFRDLMEGRVPGALHHFFNGDPRLQRLAGPYVRFQRGVRFGALAEVVEGAKLVEEKRRRLPRLPYSHPYRLFDAVLRQTTQAFLAEESAARRQLLLARQALHNGNLPLCALHCRETLLSACLEAYGQNPLQAWMDVPESGGSQEIRPRDVAAFILGAPRVQGELEELRTTWPLLATARNRYVNTSPTAVSGAQLKDEDYEVTSLMDRVARLVEAGTLARLPEILPFDAAAKEAVDLRMVRPREPAAPGRGRGGRGRRERPPRGPRRPESEAPPGAAGGPREGAGRPPRGEGPRRDRPQRHERGRGRQDGPMERRPAPGEGPRPVPAELSGDAPRVSRSGGGNLGNLGLALLQAGLVDRPAKRPEAPAQAAEAGAGPARALEPAPPPPPPPAPPPAPDFDVAGPLGPLPA